MKSLIRCLKGIFELLEKQTALNHLQTFEKHIFCPADTRITNLSQFFIKETLCRLENHCIAWFYFLEIMKLFPFKCFCFPTFSNSDGFFSIKELEWRHKGFSHTAAPPSPILSQLVTAQVELNTRLSLRSLSHPSPRPDHLHLLVSLFSSEILNMALLSPTWTTATVP